MSVTSSRAQNATGVVIGRVFNPAISQYVGNAEVRVEGTKVFAITESDGSYRLVNVPIGDAMVVVTYTGCTPIRNSVTVLAGQIVERDFQLEDSSTEKAGEILILNKYTVSAEREGNAKAIMDQKGAMNIKNSVASDTFGDVAEGNVGEFLKFMPGINLEYAESDTRTIHIRGLPAKYATVSFDGNRMANAGSSSLSTGRTFEFEQISINSVDTIEVNKTISADMDGDSVAGTVNFKSKSAFNHKGRVLNWQANIVANSYAFSLARTSGPGNASHRKILPGGILEYSDTFFHGRLGISATLSESNMYNAQYRVQNTYDNVPTATRPSAVVPVTIRIKDGPKFTERTAASLNFEYKLNPYTKASLFLQFNSYDAEFHNRQLLINSTRALLDPSSNVTTMLQSTSTTSSTVRFVLGGNSQHKFGNTGSISAPIEYKRDNLQIDAQFAYSQSINHYEDLGAGFFLNYDAWLYPITWKLERSSSDSKSWNFTQLSGRDPYKLTSYQTSAQSNNATSTPKNSRDQLWSAQANGKWTAPWTIPTFFKTGLKAREELYRLANYSYSWTYVGPTNNRTQAVVPVSPVILDPHKGGNLFDTAFQFPDRTALATLYAEHPEYFTPAASNLTSDTNLYPHRYVKEQITAAYLMGNTRLNRLTLQGGLRVEDTKDGAKTYESGVRKFRSNEYTDVFASGSAKYAFTKNLCALTSFSQAILRPDYSNLTGVASINETTQTGSIPNPELKPEHSNNYSARLEYYFEPIGILSGGCFENDITDVQYSTSSIPAEDLGLGQEYPGYTFTSTRNASSLKIQGFELEYRQQLTFLPGVFRGLGVFANYTQTHASDLILAGKRSPRVVSSGVSFAWRGINTSLKCVWTDDTYDSNVNSATNVAIRYQRARTMYDFSLSAPMPFVKRTTFFVSGRNIFNAPAIIYENTRDLIYQHDQFGVTWTMGVKGSF